MAIRTYNFTFDVKRSIMPEPVLIRQNDSTGATLINVHLVDNGVPVTINGDLEFRAMTADSQNVIADTTGFSNIDIDKGAFSYALPNQLSMTPGKIRIAYFMMVDASGNASTLSFVIFVKPAADLTPSGAKNYISIIDGLIKAFNEWNETAQSSWQDFVNANKQIIESIDPGGTLLAEVVDARNGKSNLKTRLDDEQAQVTAQLAETVKQDDLEKARKSDAVRKPIVSFISDDGSQEEITVMEPIFQSYNVPCTVAMITNNINNLEARLDLQNNHGWEFACHGETSKLFTDMTLEEFETSVVRAKTTLEGLGFKINNLVYPSGAANPDIKRISKKYFKAGFMYNDLVNTDEFMDSFTLHRVPLGAFYIEPTHNTLEYYKSKVDEAVAKNGWCIFCLHPYKPEFDATQRQYLAQLIEYIQGLGVEMTTLSEGYEIFGNAIESGSSYTYSTKDKYNRIVIRKDGVSNIPIVANKPKTHNINSLPSDFPDGKVSIEEIGNYQNAGFPEDIGGLLYTSRFGLFVTQIWMPSTSNNIYVRRISGSTFNSFQRMTRNPLADESLGIHFKMPSTGSWQPIYIGITDYVFINEFFSSSGSTVTLTKKYWKLAELSTDKTIPTVIGTAGNGRDLLAYVDARAIYFSYSTIGNNYDTFVAVTYK